MYQSLSTNYYYKFGSGGMPNCPVCKKKHVKWDVIIHATRLYVPSATFISTLMAHRGNCHIILNVKHLMINLIPVHQLIFRDTRKINYL